MIQRYLYEQTSIYGPRFFEFDDLSIQILSLLNAEMPSKTIAFRTSSYKFIVSVLKCFYIILNHF